MSIDCRKIALSLLLSACLSQNIDNITQASPLWDNWYTVSEKGTPNSYYNEKVEIDKGTIKIQVNSWIKT